MTQPRKNLERFTEFPHVSHNHMHLMMVCFTICEACARMCINEGHKDTAALCMDCADVCALAIKLHSRDSEFNSDVMELCSKVCTRCAQACAQHQAEHCQQCSQICKECASACMGED